MATDPVAATGASGASTATSSKAAASKTKLAADMNTFLNLLTTQLKYQDPMSPMDSTQFTNQLVQFASVEQGIQQNTNLESLIKLQTGNQAAMAVNYLGTVVQAETSQLPLQNQQATFSYTVPQELTSSKVVVRDSTGQVVYTANGETKAGDHMFKWEGKDNFGFPQKDGVYEVAVTGQAPDGSNVTLGTTVLGTVTSAGTHDGQVYVSMDGIEINIADIQGVAVAGSSSKNTTASSSSTTASK